MRKILPYALGVTVLVVGAVLAYNYFGAQAPVPNTQSPAAQSPAALPVIGAEEHIIGDPGAPVTIIEYASMTCPHCARFHGEILPELTRDYVDTGKVRIVFRDFPLDGHALRAAALAECAGPQRYFGFVDVLFRTQSEWTGAADPIIALGRIARLGGMDEAAFSACLADKPLLNAILVERGVGEQQFGINSTPSFVIQGKKYDNMDLSRFRALLEPLVGAR